MRMSSRGLIVTQHDVSLIPHSSWIGRPSARKYSSVSVAIGAAPETTNSSASRPSLARMPARTSSGSCAGSSMPCARSAPSIFSQMRGTAPQAVGRTDGQVLDDRARVGDAR